MSSSGWLSRIGQASPQVRAPAPCCLRPAASECGVADVSETKDFLDESPADADAGSTRRLARDRALSLPQAK